MRNCAGLLLWLSVLTGVLAQLPPPVDFNQAPTLGVSNNPHDVVSGDFNGDGKLDLAVASGLLPGSGGVIILVQNSEGTFEELGSLSVGDNVIRLVTADFNADGKHDLAAITFTNVFVLFGRGDGAFDFASGYGTGGDTRWLTVGDVNGDGLPDLITIGGRLTVLLNDGRGKFRQGATENLPGSSVAVADFNGDSKLDLVTAHSHTNFATVLLGKGDGTFRAIGRLGIEPVPPLYQPANTVLVTTGELNGDGKKDLLVAHSDVSLSLWLGNGDGTFVMGPRMRTLGGYPSDIELADLDGNGKVDLVCAAGVPTVLLATGDASFSTHYYLTGRSVGGLAVADLNADGCHDIIAADRGNLTLLFNKGTGLFAASEHYSLGHTQHFVSLMEITMLDLNKDGKLDIIGPTIDASIGFFIVRLGVGDGTFMAPKIYPLGGLTSRLAHGDLNGDGHPDIVVSQGRSLSVLLGLGDGSFTAGQSVLAIGAMALGDFNGDAKLDLVILNFNSNLKTNAAILLGRGDGTFDPERRVEAVTGGYLLATGDFNNDGKLDLVRDLDVCLGNGDGTFLPPISTNSLSWQTDVKTGDLDADGNLDVVAVSSRGRVGIYLGDGDGKLGLLNTYRPDWTTEAAAINDFNNDRHLDVAVTGDGYIHILLGLGDGTFVSGGRFVAGGGRIVAGDLNQDGLLDLVTSGGSVLMNQTFISLNVGRSPAAIELSWPGFAAGFRLESVADLTGADNWRPVARPTLLEGLRYVSRAGRSEIKRFFRLIRQ